MFKKTFIISSILLAALFLGACGTANPAGSGSPAGTLSVTGIGEVETLSGKTLNRSFVDLAKNYRLCRRSRSRKGLLQVS